MLRRMKDMEGYSIGALDGFIGEVKDYYFDDAQWGIQYLIVETGDWLASRRVLISTSVINGPNWSDNNIPVAITRDQVRESPPIDTHEPVARQHEHAANLRSGNAVMHYQVQAADGDVGHVKAILVDERTWTIRYFIVDTGHWWLGHEVLIATQWIEATDWAASKIVVSLKRQSIKDAPPYDSGAAFDRSQEARVYAHHQREAYWHGEARDESAIPHIGP